MAAGMTRSPSRGAGPVTGGCIHHLTSLSQAAKAWKQDGWLGPWADSGTGPWFTASQDHRPPIPSPRTEATSKENQGSGPVPTQPWHLPLCNALFTGSVPHWTGHPEGRKAVVLFLFMPTSSARMDE